MKVYERCEGGLINEPPRPLYVFKSVEVRSRGGCEVRVNKGIHHHCQHTHILKLQRYYATWVL